ncbi:MAG: hypothetical protein Fur0041_02420 [Bacteroidia bacterium]
MGNTGNAQSGYHPMLGDTNVWAVYADMLPVRINPSAAPFIAPNSGYISKIKDTIVNNKSYMMCTALTQTWWTNRYSLLREDTVAQQLFICNWQDTTERVIYDFSLNTGDSIHLDFLYTGNGTMLNSGMYYVDSTATVSTDAGLRKALYLSSPVNPLTFNNQVNVLTWIEGLGSTVSPVYLDEEVTQMMSMMNSYMPPQCFTNYYYLSLTCAFKDQTKIFENYCWNAVFPQISWINYFSADSCVFNLMGSTNDLYYAVQEIALSPNPGNDQTTMSFKLYQSAELQIDLYSVTGVYVSCLSGEMHYREGEHRIEIDTVKFPSGAYIIRLNGPSGSIASRLIIQH